MAEQHSTARGCVFFNFGNKYTVRLLVAISTLREYYDGPVSVFLVTGDEDLHLRSALASLKASIIEVEALTKSFDRHRVFLESPYESTLAFDSDLLFLSSIDPLWKPLEETGVLVTGFHAPPYGIDGAASTPGFANRMAFLAGVRPLLGDDLYETAARRMLDQRIDVNIGVMGLTKSAGSAFLTDLADLLARGRSAHAPLLDEMLVVGLVAKHPHSLVDEVWNCPADEFFRKTNLADARIIHYFAEGEAVYGNPLGRNPRTWAGRKWFQGFQKVARKIELTPWLPFDPLLSRMKEQRANRMQT